MDSESTIHYSLSLSIYIFHYILPSQLLSTLPIHRSFSTNIQENSHINPIILLVVLLVVLFLFLLFCRLPLGFLVLVLHFLLSLTLLLPSPTRFLRSSNSFSTSSRTGSKYRCAIASFAVSRSYRSPFSPFFLPHDHTPASCPDSRTALR